MQTEIESIDTLTSRWWILLVRGIAAILFGFAALLVPGISLLALVALFGAYAFMDGVLAIVNAISRRCEAPWWLLVLQGVTGIAAGVVTFLWPGITALSLVLLIASWALITGVLEIGSAIRLRKTITNEWLLGLLGGLSVAFGVVLFLFPQAGALAIVMWIGAYSLVLGPLLIALAVRLHQWGRAQQAAQPPAFGAG